MEESVAVSTSVNSSSNNHVVVKDEPEKPLTPTEDTSMSPEPVKEEQKTRGTKRKSSCETQLYTCEVCQVKLNSASQAYQHFQGKSHKGKVQMLELAAEVEAPAVVSISVPNNSSVPQAVHLTPSSIEYYCSICQKIFNSQTQSEQHFSGKAHRHKLSEDAIAKTSPYSSSTQFGSPTPLGAQTASVRNQVVQAQQPEIQLGSNVKCQLFTCDHCHITLNSPRQFQQHVNGLRHKIIVGKAKPPPPPQAEEPGWQEIRYKKLTTAMTTVGLLKNLNNTANINPGGTQLGQYYCKECDISVNSPLQLQQHLTSPKHKARVDGIAKGTIDPTRNKPKGRGAVSLGIKPKVIGRGHVRGRGIPSIKSSFVKAGEISTFYTTQTVQDTGPAQHSFNSTQSSFPANGSLDTQSNSYSQQTYHMQLPPYPAQMF